MMFNDSMVLVSLGLMQGWAKRMRQMIVRIMLEELHIQLLPVCAGRKSLP